MSAPILKSKWCLDLGRRPVLQRMLAFFLLLKEYFSLENQILLLVNLDANVNEEQSDSYRLGNVSPQEVVPNGMEGNIATSTKSTIWTVLEWWVWTIIEWKRKFRKSSMITVAETKVSVKRTQFVCWTEIVLTRSNVPSSSLIIFILSISFSSLPVAQNTDDLSWHLLVWLSQWPKHQLLLPKNKCTWLIKGLGSIPFGSASRTVFNKVWPSIVGWGWILAPPRIISALNNNYLYCLCD